MVKEKDEDLIKNHLVHCEFKRTSKPKCMEAILHFTPNDYFENSVLSIKAFFKGQTELAKNFEATEIQWKEGKDLTKQEVKKKQTNKKTNQTRVITNVVETDSFFSLFANTKVPDAEESEWNLQLNLKVHDQMHLIGDFEEELEPEALEHYLFLQRNIFEEMAEEESFEDVDEEE